MLKTQEASDFANGYEHTIGNQRERAAWHDCVELFENTTDSLNASLNKDVVKETVQTWLIAAKTNMDICLDRFTDINLTSNSNFTALMLARAANVSELVAKSLSMNNRRLLQVKDEESQELNSYHENGSLLKNK
ncbi:hypothetical protein SUGI_0216060 [Cryptomeria japonica]|nr:hypothetical protein SUGI_0216060 [Cryptomeria japonica]